MLVVPFEWCRCSLHAIHLSTTCPHMTSTCPTSVLNISFPRRANVIRRRWACLCCDVGRLVSAAHGASISVKAAPCACSATLLKEDLRLQASGLVRIMLARYFGFSHLCECAPAPCIVVAWHTSVFSAFSELGSALVADRALLWL